MARLRCGPSYCLDVVSSQDSDLVHADVIKVCNGNCSVAMIVAPPRKGK